MIKTELIFEKGFKWFRLNNLTFKGYIFDTENDNNSVLEDSMALDYINKNLQDIGHLKEWALALDGVFTIIYSDKAETIIITDKTNYFPVFYFFGNNNWLISDSWEHIVKQKKAFHPNTNAYPEFLSAGYVLNNETLDNKIVKTISGEILTLSVKGEIKRTSYFEFTTRGFFKEPFSKQSLLLQNLFLETAQRMVSLLKGRTAVVPLSGGYDSRLIVCMLKHVGYINTICITYGKMNPEAVISRRVAETLGFKWIFIDYEQFKYGDYLQSESFNSYTSMAGNGFSMPFLQEYFAVLELKEKKLIPDDAVFLPGHPGDFLAGSYIDNVTNTPKKSTHVAPLISRKYFDFVSNSITSQKTIESRIIKYLINISPDDDPDPKYSTAIEAWDIKEKRSKFILHSSTVFNWAGYKVAFPLWNNPIIDFFRNTPFEYRSQKRLYDHTLRKYFFIPMGVHFSKDELNPTVTDRFLFPVKKKIKEVLPMSFTAAFLKKNDWVCYGEFTELMQQELEKTGNNRLKQYKSYNAIICKWYLEELIRRHKHQIASK